jgi:hypothetical protein
MANISLFYDSPSSDGERREHPNARDIFVFSSTSASQELIELGRTMLSAHSRPAPRG